MASPPPTPPTPADIIEATDPDKRRRLIRVFTADLFARVAAEDAERAAAGLCRERGCNRPPCGVPPLPEWCGECVRAIELEWLAEEQEEDRHG